MRVTAKSLSQRWAINVAHAVYHGKGTWYHLLTRFPGALFDPEGYVIFQSEDDFRSSPFLRLNQHCHCPGGISQIPSYRKFETAVASDLADPMLPDRAPVLVSRIIRDTALSQGLKRLYENQCQICGLILELPNGRYSEAHHLRPLGQPHCGPDCRENLIVVCPTCHVRLDYFAARIDLASLVVQKHIIDPDYLAYHNGRVAAATHKRFSSAASRGL